MSIPDDPFLESKGMIAVPADLSVEMLVGFAKVAFGITRAKTEFDDATIAAIGASFPFIVGHVIGYRAHKFRFDWEIGDRHIQIWKGYGGNVAAHLILVAVQQIPLGQCSVSIADSSGGRARIVSLFDRKDGFRVTGGLYYLGKRWPEQCRLIDFRAVRVT